MRNGLAGLRKDGPKYAATIVFAIMDIALDTGDVQNKIDNYVVAVAKNNLAIDIAGPVDPINAKEKFDMLGIIGGEEGVDFTGSTFKFADAGKIELVVEYKYK